MLSKIQKLLSQLIKVSDIVWITMFSLYASSYMSTFFALSIKMGISCGSSCKITLPNILLYTITIMLISSAHAAPTAVKWYPNLLCK